MQLVRKPVHVTSPAPRDVWLELLESDPHPFLYQTPLGLDALCAIEGGEDASRLYEFPDGRRLVLPLVRRKGRPMGLTAEWSPAVGSLVSPGPVAPEQLQAVFADLAQRRVLRTVLRPTALDGDTWAAAAPRDAVKLPHRAHVLDLEGGFDTVWMKRFGRKTRTIIRKGERSGLEVEMDTTGKLVPEFYELLMCSVDRWAGQRREPRRIARWRARRRDPIRRFQLMTEMLGDACRIWVARLDGQPAAAIVVLQGANAHYTRGAMDIELAGRARATYLLQKLAIKDACEAGCRYYNMGESGTSDNLAMFKRAFGARPYSYFEYRLERFPITRVGMRMRHLAKKVLALRHRAASAAS